MKKVFGVYRKYGEEEPKLLALYSSDLEAAKHAESAFVNDKTRLTFMKSVEKGCARLIRRDYLDITVKFGGLWEYNVRLRYYVNGMEVFSKFNKAG